MRHLSIAIFVALGFGRLAAAGSPPTFEWRGSVGPDQAVEIRGINGGIRVEAADDTRAEVTATKSGTDMTRRIILQRRSAAFSFSRRNFAPPFSMK